MKKILTFLMMFAMTAGILSAQTADLQGPTLSYQVVVRDAQNNLVVDSAVKARVTILAPEAVYTEVITGRTNNNGMLALTIGLEPAMDVVEPIVEPTSDFVNPFAQIDWSIARIQMEITSPEGTRIMSYVEDVYAVPYALQSSFLLTTPQIVDYVAEWSGHGSEDVEAIIAALRSNQPFLTAIRDTVVEYVKNHFDISKQVVRYYMHKVSGDDVREAYNYYETRLNSEVKKAVVNCVKDYLKRHRSMAVELAKYYLRTTNADEIDALYAKLTANTAVYDFATEKVDAVLDDYLRSIGLDTACLHQYGFSTLCDLKAAAANMNGNPNDTCPRITSFTNTSKDGLAALAINGGIIMTAYVKNYSANKVSAYGMQIREENETAFHDRTVHYIPLANNFGKLVDTMAETNYCRDSILSKAYITVNTNHPCAQSNTNNVTVMNDAYRVPGYTLAIQRDGDKLKAVFTPVEAQQFFTSQRPNNVDWYVDNEQEPRAHGMEFTLPDNYTKITAKAHLRECRDEAEYTNN